jgi:hypothetical protein
MSQQPTTELTELTNKRPNLAKTDKNKSIQLYSWKANPAPDLHDLSSLTVVPNQVWRNGGT